MAILDRFRRHGDSSSTARSSTTAPPEKRPEERTISAKDRFRPRILLMAVLVSMGGFIFGYDTGQISGFLEMDDFLRRFGDTTNPETGGPAFSNGRSGTIVGLVS
jgi:SP family sugar:H+ symporter-like MFS transporter